MEAEAVYIKVCSHILWLCESLIQLGSCCSIFGSAHKQHLGQLCTQLIFVVLELLNKSLVLFVQERFHRQLFVQRLAAERIQFCIIHHILCSQLQFQLCLQLSHLRVLGQGSERFVWVDKIVPLNRNIFVSDLLLGDLNVFNLFLRDILRNVLSKILNCIVVGNGNFTRNCLNLLFFFVFNSFHLLWNSLNLCLILILKNFLFEGNILNSAFSLDNFFSSVNSCSNDFCSAGNWNSSSDSSLNSFDSFGSVT